MSLSKMFVACMLAGTSLACGGAQAATVTTLYQLDGTNGTYPNGLVYYNGALYGTTYSGPYGNVFTVNLSTGVGSTLYTFTGGADGGYPEGTLIVQGGLLYGTTLGASNPGTVFSVNPTTGAETVVYSFTGNPDGNAPAGGLLYQGGLLYGTTLGGGSASEDGTVFAVNPATGAETVLYRFMGGATDGAGPRSALIYQGGILYGTTFGGGGTGCANTRRGPGNGCGIVFAVNATTGAETVLHSFAGGTTDGAQPYSGLIYEGGMLYGVTSAGGTGHECAPLGCGVLYSVNATTGAETVLYNFNLAKSGSIPSGPLIDVKGKLYGATGQGIANVFDFDLATSKEKLFTRVTPEPGSGVIYQGGAYYGTSVENGGSSGDSGIVFKVTP
jgi:uncharacterized repeat protein (TIGR03803 family)